MDLQDELVIGISSQAIFDLREEEAILQSLGSKEYLDYQIAQEETTYEPGPGFSLVKMLLDLNSIETLGRRVVVVIFSPNSAASSLRIFRTIDFHSLDISRVALTSGEMLARYLIPFKVDLFLSTNSEEVREAIQEGVAAAMVHEDPSATNFGTDRIRIAFDGDAVAFSEESDRIFEEEGIEGFIRFETENAKGPVPDGAFAKLFKEIALIQSNFTEGEEPVRTALVTEHKSPSYERVIHAFRAWDVRLDEAFFLDGLPKTEVLEAFQPHIFFDDNPGSWEGPVQEDLVSTLNLTETSSKIDRAA